MSNSCDQCFEENIHNSVSISSYPASCKELENLHRGNDICVEI